MFYIYKKTDVVTLINSFNFIYNCVVISVINRFCYALVSIAPYCQIVYFLYVVSSPFSVIVVLIC